MNKVLKGIGASSGIAIGSVYLLKEPKFVLEGIKFSSVEQELKNFHQVCDQTQADLEKIIEIAKKRLSADKVEVFEAHIQLLRDVELVKEIENLIQNDKLPAALAINQIYNQSYEVFASMEDEYFKERAADVNDVKKRLLSLALNVELPDLLSIDSPCIIVAHDLTPSETAQLNPEYVKGFLVNIGGRTSHAAIMARSMEIPAILSLKNITEIVSNGEIVAMDGSSGELELNLSDQQKAVWNQRLNDFVNYQKDLEKYKTVQAKTLDGHSVLVEGNIGHYNDLPKVLENGGQGVGLFRSEFLYMDATKWPTEEEQFESYKKVLEQTDHEVIIRTLDIGGDKQLNYFSFPKEMNPFLGYRALRLSLDKNEIFETQLRALIRASKYGKLGIMFPMVATIEEFLQAKQKTLELKQQLINEGHEVGQFQIGMMIEIPTAAVFANVFSKHADFFSIGSNDLIQYGLAVDRMNDKVSYLYQPNFPGLLKLIQLAIEGSHLNHKRIGMCGEMAGELISIPLLLGLGLDAFSMSATSILAAKRLISKLNYADCQKLALKALNLETETEVNNLVKEFLSERKITY